MNDHLNQQELNTIEYYNSNAVGWATKHAGGKMFDEEMHELFMLVKSGKILEIGTGQGEDAKKLINFYGLDNYLGIEPATGLYNLAKKNNPSAQFKNEDLYSMDVPAEIFDAFWVCAMLIHVPKNKIIKALSEINNAVKSGAYGFISIMEGSADMIESRPGRYYSLWTQEDFEDKLIDSGFEVYKKRKIIPGQATPWLAYIVKKNQDS